MRGTPRATPSTAAGPPSITFGAFNIITVLAVRFIASPAVRAIAPRPALIEIAPAAVEIAIAPAPVVIEIAPVPTLIE
jgi:hypothetical protein